MTLALLFILVTSCCFLEELVPHSLTCIVFLRYTFCSTAPVPEGGRVVPEAGSSRSCRYLGTAAWGAQGGDRSSTGTSSGSSLLMQLLSACSVH
jgi:hypothetical protein